MHELFRTVPSSMLPLLVLAPVLIVVIVNDLRQLRISNATTIAALMVFIGAAAIDLPSDVVVRLIVAFSVFALGFVAFALRAIGGGDVKFLSVLVLFIPINAFVLFLNVLSISLFLGVVAIVVLRRLPIRPLPTFAGIWGTSRFPMGLSIGVAGLVYPWVVALQFG